MKIQQHTFPVQQYPTAAGKCDTPCLLGHFSLPSYTPESNAKLWQQDAHGMCNF